MKILLRRTGGFAGLEDLKEIDTMNMNDSSEADNLKQVVKSIGFFDLPATVQCDTIGADLFHYEITIIDDNRQHKVAFVYDDDPQCAPLRKLVDLLK